MSISLLCSAKVAHALPNRFDLLCKPAVGTPLDASLVKIRVDLDTGTWCSDKCLSINVFVKRDDSSWVMVNDDLFADRLFKKHITFSLKSFILSNETVYSFGNTTKIKYNYSKEPFSGFSPDKSRDAIILQPLPGPADYPLEAKRRKVSGRVKVRLEIDASGMLISCSINESSGSLDLDQGTCKFLATKGRFSSAKDVNGIPIKGSITKLFNWKI